MDAWLKAAKDGVAKLGDEVSKHADSLTQNATLLAEGMLEGASKDGCYEVTFDEGRLGFELEGLTFRVAYVDEDEQAARLGVRAGDFLAAVDGYQVPALPPADDAAGRKKARATASRWLSEMPVPCPVTFKRPHGDSAAAPGAEAAPGGALEQALVAAPETREGDSAAEPASRTGEDCAGDPGAEEPQLEAEPGQSELTAERSLVARLRAQLADLEGQLQQARAECHDLRHVVAERDEGVGTAESRLEVKLRGLQDQLARARDELETAKRRNTELQSQLAASLSQQQGLRSALARSEEVARESFEGREQVLEEEASRLRAALSSLEAQSRGAAEAAGRRAAAAEEEAASLRSRLASEVDALQSRLLAAEGKADRAALELLLQRDAHGAEAARLREEGEAAARALRAELAEREQRASRELEEARREARELRIAQADAAARVPAEEERLVEDGAGEVEEEGRGAPPAAGFAASEDEAGADRRHLPEQVAALERRCAALQKKLDARPIVSMASLYLGTGTRFKEERQHARRRGEPAAMGAMGAGRGRATGRAAGARSARRPRERPEELHPAPPEEQSLALGLLLAPARAVLFRRVVLRGGGAAGCRADGGSHGQDRTPRSERS